MKFAQDIILEPIVTEKSMAGLQEKKYTFRVAPDSNKVEIKKAVEELFKVKVKCVHTVNLKGKKKRVGVHVGKRPDWKKAIVTLTEDSKTIEFFDSLM